jgi:hypothetical protein
MDHASRPLRRRPDASARARETAVEPQAGALSYFGHFRRLFVCADKFGDVCVSAPVGTLAPFAAGTAGRSNYLTAAPPVRIVLRAATMRRLGNAVIAIATIGRPASSGVQFRAIGRLLS